MTSDGEAVHRSMVDGVAVAAVGEERSVEVLDEGVNWDASIQSVEDAVGGDELSGRPASRDEPSVDILYPRVTPPLRFLLVARVVVGARRELLGLRLPVLRSVLPLAEAGDREEAGVGDGIGNDRAH